MGDIGESPYPASLGGAVATKINTTHGKEAIKTVTQVQEKALWGFCGSSHPGVNWTLLCI